jgi:hypothetical protein
MLFAYKYFLGVTTTKQFASLFTMPFICVDKDGTSMCVNIHIIIAKKAWQRKHYNKKALHFHLI